MKDPFPTLRPEIITESSNSKIEEKKGLWLTVKPNNKRYTDEGYFQIWDEFMCLTPTISQLNQKALLCWEQRNHTNDVLLNATHILGWLSAEACMHNIVLRSTDWVI